MLLVLFICNGYLNEVIIILNRMIFKIYWKWLVFVKLEVYKEILMRKVKLKVLVIRVSVLYRMFIYVLNLRSWNKDVEYII